VLDALVSRRSLLRGLGIAVAAGIAGYTAARTSNLAKPKASSTAANSYGPAPAQGRYLAPLGAVPASGGGLILAADKLVLVREPSGQIRGFSAVCTHQGCTVALVRNAVISCPCHGSQFSALTGAVVTGPATRPLPEIPVTVQDGAVYASD